MFFFSVFSYLYTCKYIFLFLFFCELSCSLCNLHKIMPRVDFVSFENAKFIYFESFPQTVLLLTCSNFSRYKLVNNSNFVYYHPVELFARTIFISADRIPERFNPLFIFVICLFIIKHFLESRSYVVVSSLKTNLQIGCHI